jgi:acyl-CoA synthetase (AMP-forming)/AMP-acid ligase II
VIARILDRPLASAPAAPAVVGRSGALSFAELDAAADAAAGALWELGVRPGDRVAACLPNDLDVVVAFHGTQRIGAIWAGIGEGLTEAEQQTLADIAAPTVILAGPKCLLDGRPVVDRQRWAGLIGSRHAAPAVAVDPLAPAGIAFSSGTTGRPKAIVHSQHNLVLPAAVLVATRAWGPDLRKGDCLPFTILNMLVLSTLATSLAGGCTVVMDRRDSDGVAEWIQRERVTVWNGAPAQLFDLARKPHLRLPLTEVWTGGGNCPEHVREAFTAAHGLPVTTTYGLSEAPTVVAIDPVDGAHRQAASGQVLPHLTVGAYGEGADPLPAGAVGELGISAATTGPWASCWQPPLGNWEDGAVRHAASSSSSPSSASDVILTGDIGSVDSDHWLAMVDRKKLMIVRGGANVSPAEVESVLLGHPAVSAAAVFGVPDDRLGERVAALIVSADEALDAAALTSFCGRVLARYKIPEVWGRSAPLPTNAMGKIIRTDLPARLTAAKPLLPLPDRVGQVGHPLPRLRADLLQGHAARVHALEQADS